MGRFRGEEVTAEGIVISAINEEKIEELLAKPLEIKWSDIPSSIKDTSIQYLDEAFVALEILTKRPNVVANAERVLGEEDLRTLFLEEIEANEQPPLPEGIIQRKDGKFIAFEVKNSKEPDISNAIASFKSIITLAKKTTFKDTPKIQIGRLELFVPKKFTVFKDKSFSVDNLGYLTYSESMVEGLPFNRFKIEGLPIKVIKRELPPQT